MKNPIISLESELLAVEKCHLNWFKSEEKIKL